MEVETLFPLLPCPHSSCEIPHTWQSKLGRQPDFLSVSHRFLARPTDARGETRQGQRARGSAAPHALLCIALSGTEVSRGSHLPWEWQIEWCRLPHTAFESARRMQEEYFPPTEYHRAKMKNICLSFQYRHHGKHNFLLAKIQTVSC